MQVLNAAAFSAAACEIRMTPDLEISADLCIFHPIFRSRLFTYPAKGWLSN